MGIPKDGLQNLANTLEGDKDLNSPRELSAEAEKELAIVEKTIREAHVDRVNPELKCILVILPSRHSPTGILMQREDVILEWIFLPRKPNKKLKTYIEKISDLIHKGKLRLRQLTGMDPAEIVVPLTNEEVSSLWKDNEYWQRACSNFLGEINNRYPKSKRIEFIKKTEWVLPHIVRQKPISGVPTFYTDAIKLGKAGHKSGDLSKVVQSPYNSVQKAELYAILMVLMDFTEPLNIVTDSQYAERVVLHIETAEFIPDNTELSSLFIQLQEIIRNREHPIYITHIRSHTGLPGLLVQGNDEIDQLLIGNVLEASEFHKKHHVNSKGLKKDFAITWQQAKDIVKKCPTCSFYNQTPLPAGSNPKGIQRNEIWQMDVFHFMEFGRLKYVHHTIDTYSGFQWATPMSSEKADSIITHLLEVMAIMRIPVQIKTDNAPAYDQDCSLKIRELDVPVPWFLDPGGWSKTIAVSLYFIFPGMCTLSLEVNVQLLGIGTLSQVKQSARWLECIGPEGQRAKLKPYVANIAINLWGRDLLKQWNTQINIPPASETNQLTHVSERNTRRYYSNHWSPAIQIVQEQGRTTVDLPKTPTALPLKWLTDKPVWVQQWPLTTEKLQALEELVQEQLNAQHIEESTSPWNSPVFVIKKKSGKWRMVTDLRAINKVIQPMGSLQSGIPLPTLLPKGWPLIVIDLKDCFFSIPLQEKDKERFAFTVPTYNNSQPVKRYQWRVLPQGMLNSPTLCQYFVQQPLEVIRKKFPKSIIYHYMDDILLTDSNADTLERLFEEVKKILPCWGLQIAPEKIQKGDSINYLGYKIGLQKIRPQKVQIRRDRLRTLNDFQRLFGDISHLRTITGVKNDEPSNLFKTLEGDKDLNSPRELTPEAEKELALVEKKVQHGHVDREDPKLDCILVILPSRHSPTGILMQREDIILEWIFLPNKQSKKLKTYEEKISDLILKGKLRLRQLAGIDPAEIVVPLTKEEIEKLWVESEPWQRACSNFLGEINSKYPKSDRIELIKELIGFCLELYGKHLYLEFVHFIQMQTNKERQDTNQKI
ncbi:hypothetical protein STEG23_016117 [Scotinomys teguina]